MGLTISSTNVADLDPIEHYPLAGDEGFCATSSTEQDVYLPIPDQSFPEDVDPVQGLRTAIEIFSIYQDPDPDQFVTVTTPGAQYIDLFAQTVSCEGEQIQKGKLLEDTNINGVWFGQYQIAEFYDNFAFQSGYLLNHEELIPGIWFQAETKVHYYNNESIQKNASVESGYLLNDKTFYGVDFYAGQKATFYEDAKFKKAMLTYDLSIQGYDLAAGHDIEFDQSGHIKAGVLLYPENLNGIDFPALTKIELHDNGKLAKAILPQNLEIEVKGHGTMFLTAGTTVRFHKNGELAEGTLLKKKWIVCEGTPVHLSAGGNVKFYDDGSLELGMLDDNVMFHGIEYQKGNKIVFHKNGRVKDGHLADDTEIEGLNVDIVFAKGMSAEFDENGNFYGSYPKEDTPLLDYLDDEGHPILIQKHKWCAFYENGNFRKGKLAKDTVVNGFLLKEGTTINFSEDKSFKTGYLAEDTLIFEEYYGDLIWIKEGTQCGYNDRGDFFAYLAKPLIFDTDIEGRPIRLTMDQDAHIKFRYDTGQIKGGILKDTIEVWPGISFASGGWFEINIRDSDLFKEDDNSDISENYPDYIGGTITEDLNQKEHHIKEGRYVRFYKSGMIFGYQRQDKFEPYPEFYPDLYFGNGRWVEFFEGSVDVSGGKPAEDYHAFPELYDDSDNPLVLAQNQWIGFTDDYFIEGGRLAKDFKMEHEIYGEIYLKKREWVDFTEEGYIKGGRLAEDTKMSLEGFTDLIFKEGERIDFYDSGAIEGAVLLHNTTYQHPDFGDIEFKAGERIEFYESGKLKGGSLAMPQAIYNNHYGWIDLIEEEWFELYEDGEFKSGTLESELYIMNDVVGNFYVADGYEAVFYPLETLAIATLSDTMRLNTLIGHIEFLEATEIELDEDEEVVSGYLAHEYMINGEKYRFGDWIDVEKYFPD